MALPTPELPANAFDGTEGEIEKQKNALVKILADQGTMGLKTLQAQQAGAQQTAAAPSPAQLAGAPVPRSAGVQAMYDAFTNNASSKIAGHEQEQARIQAANTAYMDQTKAAVPLHKADLDASMKAMQMEFEERQRIRDQEEAARQAAAARASASAAAASSKPTYEQTQREKRDVDLKFAQEDWDKTPPELRTPQMAAQLGHAKSGIGLDEAAIALGMGPSDDPYARYGSEDMREGPALRSAKSKEVGSMMNAIKAQAIAEDWTWQELLAEVSTISTEDLESFKVTTWDPRAANIWLRSIQSLWGIEPLA